MGRKITQEIANESLQLLGDGDESIEALCMPPIDDLPKSDDAEIQAWLHGSYAKHLKYLKDQDAYVDAILIEFGKGNHDEARNLFLRHPNPDELFMFFLRYKLENPKEKAINSLEMKNAPLRPYYERARRLYPLEKAKNTRLTQEKYGMKFSDLMQREFDAVQAQIAHDEAALLALVSKIDGVVNTQQRNLLRAEIKEIKVMLGLKRLHPKPPKVRTIASWLTGL